MGKHLKQRKSEGFTIIEVMIVLAIAGLIMLIVFLAVPALQRNSRNTSVKSDAAAVGAAFNEFQSINNGLSPTGGTITGGTVTVTGAAGTTPASGKVNGATTGSISTTAAMPTNPGTVNVRIGYKCNAAGTGVGTVSTRAAAVLYVLETTGTPAPQCTES